MFKTFAKTAVAAALLVAGASQAAQITDIDLFVDAQSLSVAAPANGVAGTGTSVVAGANILGGERDVFIQASRAATFTTNLANAASVDIDGGFLSISNKSNVVSTTVIQWDGADGSATSLSTATTLGSFSNLSQGFQYYIQNVDGVFDFTIKVFSSASDYIFLTLEGQPDDDGTTAYIPLAAFYGSCGGASDPAIACGEVGTFDMTTVKAIELTVNATKDLDMTIQAVTVPVPEPTGLALVGAALAGLGLSSVRRRRSAR